MKEVKQARHNSMQLTALRAGHNTEQSYASRDVVDGAFLGTMIDCVKNGSSILMVMLIRKGIYGMAF